MNETPVNDPLVDPDAAASRNKLEKSLSDRILGYAFLASVVINVGWIALVSHSNLFGGGKSPMMLTEKKIKVFKPIPVKPKPKPVKPPPPPPKPPKVQPKITPIHPHPTPPRPRPTPTRPVPVAHTANPNARPAPSIPPAPPTNDTSPPNPGPPSPPTPVPVPPTPPAPPANPPAPPVVRSPPPVPPPPPPPPPRPKNYSPIAVQEASYPDDLGSDVTADGIDPPPTVGSKVVIAFTIDETGHFRHVHVEQSCGNSEMDRRYLESVERGHGVPAIQDHIPRDQPESVSYTIGG